VIQGDPASPILFNFVADVLPRVLIKAAENGEILDYSILLASLACNMHMILSYS
jgi:hypothetical protein